MAGFIYNIVYLHTLHNMPVRIGSVSSSLQNQVRARILSKSDKNAENASNIIGGQPAKNVPGPGRARMGSTLTARDANARAGSRSSVSSQDGDRFYTASKEPEAKHQSDKYRNSMKSQKENIVPQVIIEDFVVDDLRHDVLFLFPPTHLLY